MKKMSRSLFEQLTVIELGSVLAAPAVGVFFAELGSRVIKVENLSTGGDVTRTWKLPSEDEKDDISSYFSCVNWGKESLAIDLRFAEGRQILYELVKKSDIVLVNYKVGDAEKLATDYKTLRSYNPALIYAHITGYGLDSERAGYDAIIQSESGFTYINGEPDGPPVKLPVALMDLLAAHQLKEAILVALIKRMQSGQGSYVASSLFQSGVASLANQATNWLVAGKIPQRMGSDHPNIVPYGTIFKTADEKEIVLAVGSDKQFAKLCEIIQRPELSSDQRFSTNYQRVIHRDELKAILRKEIARFNRDELLDQLEKNHVPAGAVNNIKEVFETEAAKKILLSGQTGGRTIKGMRNVVFEFQGENVCREKLSPPPHFGEHTAKILKEFLQLNAEEYMHLKSKGVIYERE